METVLNIKGLSEPIIRFRNDNKHLETTLEEFFLGHTNKSSIHNHTIENLFLYYGLDKYLSKNRVIFYPNAIWIVTNLKHKFFVYDDSSFISKLNIESIKQSGLENKFLFYSSNIQEVDKDIYLLSKCKESNYVLDEIFNEQTYFSKYSNKGNKYIKKKIYNRIQYPFNFLSKNSDKFKVEDITEQHLEIVESLHSQWAQHKLDDPKTFKMMFYPNRYNRCVYFMFGHPLLQREDFFCKLFYWEGRPIAVRQILVKEIEGRKYSFDIGFFSLFWEVPSQLVLFINAWCLKELQNLGVVKHNTGMLMDKYLTVSKDHFPSHPVITYKYNIKK